MEKEYPIESIFIESAMEKRSINFVRWYIQTCKNQEQPIDGEAYDLPDAYADYLESLK